MEGKYLMNTKKTQQDSRVGKRFVSNQQNCVKLDFILDWIFSIDNLQLAGGATYVTDGTLLPAVTESWCYFWLADSVLLAPVGTMLHQFNDYELSQRIQERSG